MPTPSLRATLEVPVDSIEGARLAIPFADRLELCHDLSSEGWTPRSELVRAAREAVEGTSCTVVAMIRPELPGARRELDVAAFTATPAVLDASLREIEACAKAGAHSVAVGLLTPDGHVDLEACGRMKALADQFGLVAAFLRTFDLIVDRRRAMRDLTSLGFVRVVTAGVLGWDASVSTLHERLEVLAAHARTFSRASVSSCVSSLRGTDEGSSDAMAFGSGLQNPKNAHSRSFTFTFICHPGKTRTPWREDAVSE